MTEPSHPDPAPVPAGNLLSSLAHELRTPLNSIIGFSDVLLDGGGGSITPEQRTQLGMINRSGLLLLDRVDRLLDLWRLESGGLALHVSETDLREVLRPILARFARAARDRGLGCRVELDAGLRLRTDPARVVQVLDQLLRNALQYTASGGVTVQAVRLDRCVRISVEDTGCGIEPGQRAALFGDGADVCGGDRHGFDAGGLGLALAARLVDALGGRIGLRSEPGRGSEFWFDLPLD